MRSRSDRVLAALTHPSVIAPAALFVTVVMAWQAGVFHGLFGLRTFSVPYPSVIVEGSGEAGRVVLRAVGATVPAALIGYATGMGLGFLIASALVRFAPGAVAHVLPMMSAVNALPIVALAPVVALFTGSGVPLKVIVVTIMTAPVMVVYAVRGFMSIEANAAELMASIEATPGQLYRMVRVPSALPFLFTALKSSVVLALIGTIVSEAVKGREGLGYVIVDSMGDFEAAVAWLALITIATLGIVWYVLIGVVERLVIPWEGHRRSSGGG